MEFRETIQTAYELSIANYKNEVVDLQRRGVRFIEGQARIADLCSVTIDLPNGEKKHLKCDSIVLAVGSELPLFEKSERVLTLADLRKLQEIPSELAILGSSSASLELAYFFSAYGSSVTVVGVKQAVFEFFDNDLRKVATEQAMNRSIQVITDATAIAGTTESDSVDVLLSDGSHVDASHVLLCGEGKCRTEGLGLDDVGVQTTINGEISVDEEARTNIATILAVGSATGQYELPFIRAQAKVAAQNAAGGSSTINYGVIPITAVFDPEVGSVGLSEDKARQMWTPISACTTSRSTASGKQKWAKVVADKSSGRVLGVHLAGEGAVEAVQAGVLAVHGGMTVDDLAETQPPGETMSQQIKVTASILVERSPEEFHPIVLSPD
jgi:pyruvate/2-oxoglutarate dehydrogenase complex dihydrolipoamide dehydrogenase (E3) component